MATIRGMTSKMAVSKVKPARTSATWHNFRRRVERRFPTPGYAGSTFEVWGSRVGGGVNTSAVFRLVVCIPGGQ